MADTDEQTTELDFTEAFNRLADLGDKPVPSDILTAPAPTSAAEAPAVEAQEEAEGEEGEAQTPPAATEEPSAAAAAAPAPAAPAPALTPEEMLAQIRDAVMQRPEAPATPAAPAAPAAPAEAAMPDPATMYSPEEQQLLTRYMDEWPEVAQAEALRRRGEYQQIVQHVFEQFKAYLQPFEQTLSAVAAETQFQQLQQVVPDFNTIDPNAVKAWVDQQPAYLQPAYQHVIERGTPDEVADLIQRYRQSTTPAAAPAAPATPAAPPAPKKVEPALPADAKQAASSLAPVSSKRSSVAPITEPSDFDSAFEAAAKTL